MLLPLIGTGTAAASDSCTPSVTWDYYSYTDIAGNHYGHKVYVHWNPCNRPTRARAHCQNFPYGTYYVYGNTINSTGTSVVACGGGNPQYGSQGWQEYYGGSWHYHQLFAL